jgi:hypothetical protein
MVDLMALSRDDSSKAEPDYVQTLFSGVHPTTDTAILDTSTMKDLARQVREIEEARAAAAVSGRDYLIR